MTSTELKQWLDDRNPKHFDWRINMLIGFIVGGLYVFYFPRIQVRISELFIYNTIAVSLIVLWLYNVIKLFIEMKLSSKELEESMERTSKAIEALKKKQRMLMEKQEALRNSYKN